MEAKGALQVYIDAKEQDNYNVKVVLFDDGNIMRAVLNHNYKDLEASNSSFK